MTPRRIRLAREWWAVTSPAIDDEARFNRILNRIADLERLALNVERRAMEAERRRVDALVQTGGHFA